MHFVLSAMEYIMPIKNSALLNFLGVNNYRSLRSKICICQINTLKLLNKILTTIFSSSFSSAQSIPTPMGLQHFPSISQKPSSILSFSEGLNTQFA